MYGQITWQIAVQTVVSVVSILMLVRVTAYRSIPKAKYFVILTFAVFIYSAGYLLELDAHTLEGAYMAQRVQYYGISTYAVLFFLFIRDYVNRGITRRWVLAALFVYPLISIWTVNAYPDRTWFFRDMVYSAGPPPRLEVAAGPMMWGLMAYNFTFVALSAATVLRYYPRRDREDRLRNLFFLAAALVPGVSVVLMAVGIDLLPMQIDSAALALALLVLGYYLTRYRAEDWLPFARGQVLEKLSEGYILLDSKNRFLDANEAAIAYFPALGGLAPRTPVAGLKNFPLAMLAGGGDEITLERGDETVTLTASVTPIYDGDKLICNGIQLFDVTERRRLIDELEEAATHDGLTGLLNRQALMDMARRDIELHRRLGNTACAIMLDIDHFKVVNDTFGHQGGDSVLQGLARLMTGRLRRTDILGRYGGEEFFALLPVTGLSGAVKTAEHLRRAVERTVFVHDGRRIRVTVSIGVAQLDPESQSTLEDLAAAADAALYQAKRGGRNRVSAAVPRQRAREAETNRDMAGGAGMAQ